VRRTHLLLFLITVCAVCRAQAEHPGAIASAHPIATEAGLEILRQGGNAFDAAVAVSAVLAVVEPYSSGIGGGGFWLLHRARDGKQIMIDGREKAPKNAHRDMYLDANGKVIPGLSLNGPLAAGIPGEIAALVHIANNYGRLPLAKTLAPAIHYAEKGFVVTDRYRKLAAFRLDVLRRYPEAANIFLVAGEVPTRGHRIVQKDLASTLRRVAEKGRDGFYDGEIAAKLVLGVQAAGGIWTEADLKNYAVEERSPVIGSYNGIKITSAAPPSSGGMVLVEILNMLKHKNLPDLGGIVRKHVIIEAMKRAYRDRAEYLGDPDFITIPFSLVSKPYATIKGASIKLYRATPSALLGGGKPEEAKGTDTTHFSILDTEGNRVAATLSINYPFGSCFVVPGTGVLLNDEMDDFSIHPGVPNVYGLIGNEANAIEPGKRPLSSMTPTFLETEDRVAILGTPGGSRIISMVLLAVLDFAEGNPPKSWVSLSRYHHQYLPDEVQFEPGAFTELEKQTLKRLGHKLKPLSRRYGNMQAILLERETGRVEAASDPRGEGRAQFTLPKSESEQM